MQSSSSITPLTLSDELGSQSSSQCTPTPKMTLAATQITRMCLRQWDGLFGVRAASDSVGTKAGIWRAKFEGVRCAVLLLAFNRLNRNLQAQSTPSKLLVLRSAKVALPAMRASSHTRLTCRVAKVQTSVAMHLPMLHVTTRLIIFLCVLSTICISHSPQSLRSQLTCTDQGGSGTCFIVRSFLTSVPEAHYSGMSHEKFLSV